MALQIVQEDADSRCSSPNQRCASRASQLIYGIANEENKINPPESDRVDRLTLSTHVHRAHPRQEPVVRQAYTPSPKKLRKTISGALDITEDVGLTAIGTPNLSKMWHHTYRRQLVYESSSRASSPRLRGRSPVSRGRSPLGPLAAREYNTHIVL